MGCAAKKVMMGGGVVAVLSTLLLVSFPNVLETGVRGELILEEGNDFYANFVNLPLVIDYKFHFFNVENPQQAARGAKIKVREVGPYWFKQHRKKRILGWGDNKETIKYVEYKTYIFNANLSRGLSLDDIVTVINPVLCVLGAAIGDLVQDALPLQMFTSPLAMGAANAFIQSHGETLFFNKTVRDLIYGYKVNFLDTMSTLTRPLEPFGINNFLPTPPPDNTFGILYAKNNTPEGPYETYTGQFGTSVKYGHFASYKDETKVSWWGGDYCNRILGSDGTQFPPFLKKTDSIYIFSTDVCRTIALDFQKETEVTGIPTFRFYLDADVFASPKTDPRNECFCTFPSRPYRCATNGVLDISSCSGKAPLVLSFPHFFATQPDLSRTIDGLAPDQAKHQTVIDVEPMTGGAFLVAKRLQINIRLERVPLLTQFQSIRSALVPFVWIEEFVELSNEISDDVKGKLFNPVSYASTSIGGLAFGGWAAVVGAFVYNCFSKQKKKGDEPHPSEKVTKTPVTVLKKNGFISSIEVPPMEAKHDQEQEQEPDFKTGRELDPELAPNAEDLESRKGSEPILPQIFNVLTTRRPSTGGPRGMIQKSNVVSPITDLNDEDPEAADNYFLSSVGTPSKGYLIGGRRSALANFNPDDEQEKVNNATDSPTKMHRLNP